MTAPTDDRFDRAGLVVLAVMWALFLIALGAMVFTAGAGPIRSIHAGSTSVPVIYQGSPTP